MLEVELCVGDVLLPSVVFRGEPVDDEHGGAGEVANGVGNSVVKEGCKNNRLAFLFRNIWKRCLGIKMQVSVCEMKCALRLDKTGKSLVCNQITHQRSNFFWSHCGSRLLSSSAPPPSCSQAGKPSRPLTEEWTLHRAGRIRVCPPSPAAPRGRGRSRSQGPKRGRR